MSTFTMFPSSHQKVVVGNRVMHWYRCIMGFGVCGLCARNMGFCNGLVHDPGTIGRCIGHSKVEKTIGRQLWGLVWQYKHFLAYSIKYTIWSKQTFIVSK